MIETITQVADANNRPESDIIKALKGISKRVKYGEVLERCHIKDFDTTDSEEGYDDRTKNKTN